MKYSRIIILIILFIVGLILLILAVAFKSEKKSPSFARSVTPVIASPVPTKNPHAFAALWLEKTVNGIDIHIDTKTKAITGVQIAMQYDPTLIQNIHINSGTIFATPVILRNSIDQQHGTFEYAVVIHSTDTPIVAKGVLATITYEPVLGVKSNAIFYFLPRTNITSQTTDESVLQTTRDFVLSLTQK